MFSAVQTLLSLLTVRHNFYTKENIDEFDNLQTIFQYHLITYHGQLWFLSIATCIGNRGTLL